MDQLAAFYRNKTVLVTGHTGFKGSWMTAWLTHLGARVIGYALDPPSTPNMFEACGLGRRVIHATGDICDREAVRALLAEHRPSLVFHLAAQSLVRPSIADPTGTFQTNVIGTVNVLEAALASPSVRGVVAVTSDKCYLNNDWVWGYRETDALGGHEPYSASKACAELAIACFQNAAFQRASKVPRHLPIASVRAGNVIGGGDWATDRIIPDVVRSIVARRDVVVRNPGATRPWQHVLEPLSGYLWVGTMLGREDRDVAGAWNFGPRDEGVSTVTQIVEGILARWQGHDTHLVVEPDRGAEARLLRLDYVKARELLEWAATWTVGEALDAIVSWYSDFYADEERDLFATTIRQIDEYTQRARALGRAWAQAVAD